MHSRRTPRIRRRPPGYTLVELLVVIAIIAVLSGLAIAGYRRYLNASETAEVRAVFGQIRNGEEAYRVEMLKYLSVSASLSTYYPNTNPNDSRWVWERSTDPRYNDPTFGWSLLNVHPDAPVRFGYAVMAGVAPNVPGALDPSFATPPAWPTNFTDGTPWFVVTARNSHGTNGAASLAVTASWDGSIYTEGDSN